MGFRVFEQKDEGWETENVELPKRGINLRFPFLEKDTSIYELQKFLKMIRKKNPNILELLFVEDSNQEYICKDPLA